MIPNPRIANVTDLYSDDFAFDAEVDAETRNVPVYCIWQDKLPFRLLRYAIQWPFFKWVRWYLKAETQGLENLPRRGPMILASNHISHADTGLILSSLPFNVRTRTAAAAAKDFWFTRRLKSTLVRLYFNALAVTRRGQGSRSMVSELVKYIRRGTGRALIIYPEGGRVQTEGGLGELKSGFARIALIANVPVVPVAITGTDKAMPKGSHLGFWPSGQVCRVQFGKPIEPEDFAEVMRQNEVRAARAMTAELRRRLLDLLDLPAEPELEAIARGDRTRKLRRTGTDATPATPDGRPASIANADAPATASNA